MENNLYQTDGKFNTDNSAQSHLYLEVVDNYYAYAIVDAERKLKVISANHNSIFSNIDNSLLSLNYQSTQISLNTNKFTFIPNAFYQPQNQSSYNAFIPANNQTTYSHQLLNNTITALNVFDNLMFEGLKTKFPSANIYPQYLPFIESVVQQFSDVFGAELFINIKATFVEILILNNQNLIYYNTLPYFNGYELLYLITTACQQGNLQSKQTTLHICGNLTAQSETYQILKCSFANVKFFQNNAVYKNYGEFNEVELYRFFSLLSLSVCV